MKKKFMLSPSLAEIEQRIFGVSEALIQMVEEGSVSSRIAAAVKQSSEWATSRQIAAEGGSSESGPSAEAPPMPPQLLEMVRRRTAARTAGAGKEAAPGRVVQVRRIVTPHDGQLDWVIQAPLHVLLDAPAEVPGVWHGWLMAPEADYATWWDFVLQEEDAPFEPEAAMVQAWNPVRLYAPMIDSVVGELTPARLQAVRALAGEYATGDAASDQPAWPGRVALRTTLGDLPVATGSPVRADDDPRVRYQQIYFRAADAVREPARLALAEAVRAPSKAAALLRRLIDAAHGIGQELLPVPRVERAMSKRLLDPGLYLEVPAIVAKRTVLGPLGRLKEKQIAHKPAHKLPELPEAPLEGGGDGDERVADVSTEASEDLLWPDKARIRVVAFDGITGRVEITALPGRKVVCRLQQGGVTVDRATAKGEEMARLDWENAAATVLSLASDDGCELSLPLSG